jgi:hypothetical protein
MRKRDVIVWSVAAVIITATYPAFYGGGGVFGFAQWTAMCTIAWLGPEVVHRVVNVLAPDHDTTKSDCARAALWLIGVGAMLGAIYLVRWRPIDVWFFVLMLITAALLAIAYLWRVTKRLGEMNGDFDDVEEEEEDLDLVETQKRTIPVVPSRAMGRLHELHEAAKRGEVVDYVDRTEGRHGDQGHGS